MTNFICAVLMLTAFVPTTAAFSYSSLTCVVPNITDVSSHCPRGADRYVTLNDLINSHSNQRGRVFNNGEDVVFSTGKHIVNGKLPLLFATQIHNIRLRGQTNAAIVCRNEFLINFDQISGDIMMLNLQFQNCTGHFGQYKATLVFRTTSASRIKFHNIHIVTRDGVGIVVGSEGGTLYSVYLSSSFLSTGGIGFRSEGFLHGSRIKHSSVKIHNTTFNDSCLEIQTQYVSYTVEDTSFIRCKCSPLLSLDGIVHVKLKNIYVSGNTSPILLYSIGSLSDSSVIILEGNCTFFNNTGTVSLNSNSNLILNGANVEFIDNHVQDVSGYPGTIILVSNSIIYINHSHLLFVGNHGQHCGGITLMKSNLLLSGNSSAVFKNNRGHKGGALLSLYAGSILIFVPCRLSTSTDDEIIDLNFLSNRAEVGGAIYVEDRDYIDPFSHNLTSSIIVRINFKDRVKFRFVENAASFGGDDIYGGWIDLSVNLLNKSITYVNNTDLFKPQGNNSVSSDPTRVCMCSNSIPDCSVSDTSIEIFPGQTLNLQLVAVGQRYGTVKAFIYASIVHDHPLASLLDNDTNGEGRIGEIESVQTVERNCTSIKYTIFSPNKKERIVITPFENENTLNLEPIFLERYPEFGLMFKQVAVTVNIKDCPLAFYFNSSTYECTCMPSLVMHNLICNRESLKIVRSQQQWVGSTFEHTIPEDNPGIIAHQHCPFDYCRRDQESLTVSFESEYHECSFNRFGILCGACQPNFSQLLGSSKCKQCSNSLMVLAIVPGVLVAGVILVIFLMFFNLTVSAGSINSLIFYANVIRTQHTTFFTPDISDSFLSKFIAWLNLDLGVETCFYNTLDAYGKVWLQFLFPLYIWMLTLIIIISSHYSSLASRLAGNNAVQVLATLFLLSYTKILQIAITVFSSTTIVYPDGYTKSVWLYDGNVEFLAGKHIALFGITLLLVIFFIVPYTLSLVSIQWLLKISHYRTFFWVQRLKPYFDAYTGPYKITHRYWTGVLLISRIVLLVIFSLTRENSPSINILAIVVISFALIVWLYFTRWVYTTQLLNILEIISLCNLCLISIGVLFELSRNKQSPIVIYTSSGITLALFIMITTYHAYMLKQDFLTKKGTALRSKLQRKLFHTRRHTINIDQDPLLESTKKEVTSTIVELSELKNKDS